MYFFVIFPNLNEVEVEVEVEVIVAGGNARPPAHSDSPDITTRVFHNHHLLHLKKTKT